jgi:putative methyltransferase (TIGR04325 family)
MKKNLKLLLPPIVLKKLKRSGLFNNILWRGNYKSWQEATAHSSGYDSNEIIEKVKTASLKVKSGEAVYERDSVLFDKIEYAWATLASILWIYARESNIKIIDFGGALGSSYYQNRKFLNSLQRVEWFIVEQKKFVEIGRESFQVDNLKFFFTVEDVLKENKINCLLMSCVLPYIKSPYDLLNKLLEYRIKYIIFDRMPFIAGDNDRLTVQSVPKSIYKASYPAWFFSEKKFLDTLLSEYTLIEEFPCLDEATIESNHKGMLFELRK